MASASAPMLTWTERSKLTDEVIEKLGGLAQASSHFAKIMHDNELPGTEAFIIPFLLERVAEALCAAEDARMNAALGILPA